MELALGAASSIIGKALNTLADDFEQAKIASADLGENVRNIKAVLSYTLSLLHEAERRRVSTNHGLVVLLHQLNNCPRFEKLPLEFLRYLTDLRILNCKKFRMDEYDELHMQDLKRLVVYNSNTLPRQYSEAPDLIAKCRLRVMTDLEELEVDSISGVLAAPICTWLSESLRTLSFRYDDRVICFTQDQGQALQLLTSLRELRFQCCSNLQSLPEGLHRLPCLEKLVICSCPALQPPTEEELLNSLVDLDIHSGCGERQQCKNYKKGASYSSPWDY